MKRILFSAQEKFLNLSAKSGSGATSRKEEITTIPTKKNGFNTKCKRSPFTLSNAIGRNAIKIVFAGVGTPIKESD